MTPEMQTQVRILLVEDNPGDVALTTEALGRSKVNIAIDVVSDGEEAMRFLRREGDHAAALRPHLVLLDLNLPRKDGREVLREVRADESLCEVPIIVLTTSQDEPDVVNSYCLHANSYISKPGSVKDFMACIRSFSEFWFGVASVPGHQANTSLIQPS